MHVPQFRLMFDIGRGSSQLTEVPRLLLTHGHLDHSSGVPYYISQRNLRRLAPADIYVPPELYSKLNQVLQLWCDIEGYQSEYSLHAIDYDKTYPLHGNFYFKALRSVHRVPSNGYTIMEKSIKLKEEFRKLTGVEITKLRKERKDIFYENHVPHITFSGDTQIEFVLDHPEVQRSHVLFLECTYIDEARSIEQTRKWGHLHLDEIVNHAEAFRDVQQLYLIHFSPRYRAEKIRRLIKEKLPNWLYAKTIPFLYRKKVS